MNEILDDFLVYIRTDVPAWVKEHPAVSALSAAVIVLAIVAWLR